MEAPSPSTPRFLLGTCARHQWILGHVCGGHDLDHLLLWCVFGQRGDGSVHEVLHSHPVRAAGRGVLPSGPGAVCPPDPGQGGVPGEFRWFSSAGQD